MAFNYQSSNLIFPFLFQFEYNVEYELLKYNLDISTVEGGLTGGNVIDSIRYLQLGKTPAVLRRCLRCGACSSLTSVARTPAMKAWEQRWVRKCRYVSHYIR